MENKNTKVFVGLSGGVDSSVSAYLLKKAGYNVTGVFIRTWQPDFIECTWRDERRDAMRIAAELDIPFLECDAEEAYKRDVAEYMIEEYRKGRTPNPDVMCNRVVKFGVFWKFAKERGANYIATGHYAKIINNEKLKMNNYELHCGNDKSKDQSYFLWKLEQEDLSHTMFPVGHLNKDEVRKIAEIAGISTAKKKDSQGVCFLGMLDMKDFLAHYIEKKKGNVLDLDGNVIGEHDGALFFTLGERHGFAIWKKEGNEQKPLYVVGKNVEKNEIIVSERDESESINNIMTREMSVPLEYMGKGLTCQIRYHGDFLKCQIQKLNEKGFEVVFEDQAPRVASGQSIVFYDGENLLGGGVVI